MNRVFTSELSSKWNVQCTFPSVIKRVWGECVWVAYTLFLACLSACVIYRRAKKKKTYHVTPDSRFIGGKLRTDQMRLSRSGFSSLLMRRWNQPSLKKKPKKILVHHEETGAFTMADALHPAFCGKHWILCSLRRWCSNIGDFTEWLERAALIQSNTELGV